MCADMRLGACVDVFFSLVFFSSACVLACCARTCARLCVLHFVFVSASIRVLALDARLFSMMAEQADGASISTQLQVEHLNSTRVHTRVSKHVNMSTIVGTHVNAQVNRPSGINMSDITT